MVRLRPNVEPSVVLHELGHVVDVLLHDRALGGGPQAVFSINRLLDHPQIEEIEREFEIIGRNAYPEEFLSLVLARKNSSGWGLASLRAAVERRRLEKFFDTYATLPQEAFANLFASLMLDPNQARRDAPILASIISEQMGQHDDLRALAAQLAADRSAKRLS